MELKFSPCKLVYVDQSMVVFHQGGYMFKENHPIPWVMNITLLFVLTLKSFILLRFLKGKISKKRDQIRKSNLRMRWIHIQQPLQLGYAYSLFVVQVELQAQSLLVTQANSKHTTKFQSQQQGYNSQQKKHGGFFQKSCGDFHLLP